MTVAAADLVDLVGVEQAHLVRVEDVVAAVGHRVGGALGRRPVLRHVEAHRGADVPHGGTKSGGAGVADTHGLGQGQRPRPVTGHRAARAADRLTLGADVAGVPGLVDVPALLRLSRARRCSGSTGGGGTPLGSGGRGTLDQRYEDKGGRGRADDSLAHLCPHPGSQDRQACPGQSYELIASDMQ